jgi:hypothetical protein
MSVIIERVRAAGEPFGLNLVAAVPTDRYDAAAAEPYRTAGLDPQAKSIVVIANGGGALWAALKRHAEHNPGWMDRDHPLDDFTRTVVENEIAPAIREAGARCTIVFPFMSGKATLNFIELGKAACVAGPSILGVLIHPKFGPWMAFRAAILIDRLIDEPGEARDFDPCPSCTQRSCITACPTGAVSYPSGWDIPRCVAYRIEVEADCRSRCHARVACVVGPEHRYPDDEIAHHHGRAFRAMRPWYEKNIKGRDAK